MKLFGLIVIFRLVFMAAMWQAWGWWTAVLALTSLITVGMPASEATIRRFVDVDDPEKGENRVKRIQGLMKIYRLFVEILFLFAGTVAVYSAWGQWWAVGLLAAYVFITHFLR